MTTVDLLHRPVVSEQDVFTVRLQARQLALRLGLSGHDQIRFAAALSEVGRRLLTEVGGLTLDFTLTDEVLSVRTSAAGPVSDDVLDAIEVTRRLVDTYQVDRSPSGVVVTLARVLPRSGPTERR